jgi:glycyl-tRNA synthetase beta chain
VIREPEAPAKDALATLLPDLITGLSFPKSMRWGAGTIRFGRPLRWILALVDEEVVEFSVGEVHSGRLARGHPVLADGMFEVKHAAEYERALEGRFVIVQTEKRKAAIEQQLRAIADGEGAKLVDGGLLEETTYLIEWPTAALGAFSPDFLSLPRPVLVEEMQHVQSYFPLDDRDGKLLPRFIAVRDGGTDHLGVVIAGWESVLRAKLIDASYFYEQDQKRALGDRVDDLHGVVFQESLGSMHEKMERIRAIAGALADAVGLATTEKAALDRAALLCKADLTTEVVQDVSNLQGVMGREYALASGEQAEVADAIGEHYRPRFAGDEVPHSRLGRLLAIADKLDTVVACFAVGIVPTGSADPYGLRREASGVVAIAQEAEQPFSLSALVEAGVRALSHEIEVKAPAEQIASDVLAFIRLRLETYLRDEGVPYDIVNAVVAVGIDDIHYGVERANALSIFRHHESFPKVVTSATRMTNITKGYGGGSVVPELLTEPSERDLWEAYKASKDRRSIGDLYAAFAEVLAAPIDRFFTDVLVMAEDEKVRNNRLALCWQVNQLFRKLADFTVVVQA